MCHAIHPGGKLHGNASAVVLRIAVYGFGVIAFLAGFLLFRMLAFRLVAGSPCRQQFGMVTPEVARRLREQDKNQNCGTQPGDHSFLTIRLRSIETIHHSVIGPFAKSNSH
jgi:hypothetical protein